MLVSARPSYISIDRLPLQPGDIDHYYLGIASLLDRPRVTLTNRNRTILNETSIITIESFE